jgi:hypothetical protein
MINKKFKYRVKFVKFPQEKYTVCSIGVKDKTTGNYKNYEIFSFGKHDLKDGDEIQILEIESVDINFYNGKEKVVVNAKYIINSSKEETRQETSHVEEVYEPVLDIDTDDLPF